MSSGILIWVDGAVLLALTQNATITRRFCVALKIMKAVLTKLKGVLSMKIHSLFKSLEKINHNFTGRLHAYKLYKKFSQNPHFEYNRNLRIFR